MIRSTTVIDWFELLSSKLWNTYVFPRSYISVLNTLATIGLNAETQVIFINISRYKIFEYKVLKWETTGKLGLTSKINL